MNAELVRLAAKCTAKQRAFVHELAAGVPPSEAYRRGYGSVKKDKCLAAKASHTKASPNVSAYLHALIGEQEKTRFLTRERKREKLAAIVNKDAERTADRIKAIEVDNVMTGDNAPQQ